MWPSEGYRYLRTPVPRPEVPLWLSIWNLHPPFSDRSKNIVKILEGFCVLTSSKLLTNCARFAYAFGAETTQKFCDFKGDVMTERNLAPVVDEKGYVEVQRIVPVSVRSVDGLDFGLDVLAESWRPVPRR